MIICWRCCYGILRKIVSVHLKTVVSNNSRIFHVYTPWIQSLGSPGYIIHPRDSFLFLAFLVLPHCSHSVLTKHRSDDVMTLLTLIHLEYNLIPYCPQSPASGLIWPTSLLHSIHNGLSRPQAYRVLPSRMLFSCPNTLLCSTFTTPLEFSSYIPVLGKPSLN